tara:strand:+ start:373 stop:501 length:129 start_codon:yes stop_codon:yes gene_type:complete
MWRFLVGFASGVYVGTYYNCKPMIHELEKKFKEYIPDKKNKN